MRLSISTPYSENAIVNIARAAEENGQLQRFYTTLYLAQWQVCAERVPLVGRRLGRRLGRRGFPGIPPERVTNMAALPEFGHACLRRLFGKHWLSATTGAMYRVKAQFDSALAQTLNREPPAALVGMYGASLESFRVVQRHGGMAIMNFVNSHPAEHNRYLIDLAGVRTRHHELIPGWVSQRVEAELDLADLVLAPSKFVSDQLRAHGVRAEKIVTLPYGVDLEAFNPPQRVKSDGEMLECLYVGQISYRKGISTLLKVAERSKDLPVRFRLIGPVVSPELLQRLPSNVVYQGSRPKEEVAEAMRRADIFVLPTIEDACALVVLEAMASGLPVVTTTNNGSGEIIDAGKDGLIVPPGEAAPLAEAIGGLIEQSALRYRMGAAARAKVEKAHSWEVYRESVLEVIETRRQATPLSEAT